MGLQGRWYLPLWQTADCRLRTADCRLQEGARQIDNEAVWPRARKQGISRVPCKVAGWRAIQVRL